MLTIRPGQYDGIHHRQINILPPTVGAVIGKFNVAGSIHSHHPIEGYSSRKLRRELHERATPEERVESVYSWLFRSGIMPNREGPTQWLT